VCVADQAQSRPRLLRGNLDFDALLDRCHLLFSWRKRDGGSRVS
jgi:hypothetical protein